MMKLFYYHGDHDDIKEAVALANHLYDRILDRLRLERANIMTSTRGKYNRRAGGHFYTTENLAFQIGVFSSMLKMEVKEYYYKNENVLGYYSAAKPNDINLNINSFPREIPSIVATLYHELMHKLDTLVDYDLGHGKGWFRNFYKRWKEECAPFLVDNIAEIEAMIYLGIEDAPRTDNTKYVTVPLWKRILFFWRY